MGFVCVGIPDYPAEFVNQRSSSLHFPSTLFRFPSQLITPYSTRFRRAIPRSFAWIPVLNLSDSPHNLSPHRSIGTVPDIQTKPVEKVYDMGNTREVISWWFRTSGRGRQIRLRPNPLMDMLVEQNTKPSPLPTLKSLNKYGTSSTTFIRLRKAFHRVIMRHLPVLRVSSIPARVHPVRLPDKAWPSSPCSSLQTESSHAACYQGLARSKCSKME